MKLMFRFLFLMLLTTFSFSLFGATYTELYKCKFLQQSDGPPRPDSISLYFHPLISPTIEWTRPYYKESFVAESIFIHNDPFVKQALLPYEVKRVRAFKVAANNPVSTHFMRFIVLLDSIKNNEIVSGKWVLTSKDSFLENEKVIATSKLNCKRKH